MSDVVNDDGSFGFANYEPDDTELETSGRIYESPDGLICANCGGTNIKVSKAGNKYCADLCWVEKEIIQDDEERINQLKASNKEENDGR